MRACLYRSFAIEHPHNLVQENVNSNKMRHKKTRCNDGEYSKIRRVADHERCNVLQWFFDMKLGFRVAHESTLFKMKDEWRN